MQISLNPPKAQWAELLKRPDVDVSGLFATVEAILKDIKMEGDAALRHYSEKFDGFAPQNLLVSQDEIDTAIKAVSPELKRAIQNAMRNVETFHRSQLHPVTKVTTQQGVTCWQKSVAIEKVGLYIPGGTAPLFSTVLMLAVPAKLAGCSEIVLCTPPSKDGSIHPAILYTASLVGVSKIYKLGGVQAIGAMAYGTQSVPKVYKIFGPGNRFVTAAKQLVSLKDVAIDMPAGPSEVLVMGDESANPAFVAADLLSQAEHGADSQVVFVTDNEQLLNQVVAEVKVQVAALPRVDAAVKALDHSRAILVQSLDEMVELSNQYAPEHLIMQVKDAAVVAERIINAGSVFIGHYTPESAGDYASGTNHTLPTHGYATAYSGVNMDSYIRKITFQEITPKGLQNLGPVIECMAEAELLEAHKNAVTLRLRAIYNDENAAMI